MQEQHTHRLTVRLLCRSNEHYSSLKSATGKVYSLEGEKKSPHPLDLLIFIFQLRNWRPHLYLFLLSSFCVLMDYFHNQKSVGRASLNEQLQQSKEQQKCSFTQHSVCLLRSQRMCWAPLIG